MRRLALSLLLIAACDRPDRIEGPTVSAFRSLQLPAGKCYGLMTEAAPDAALASVLTPRCPADTTVTRVLTAGVDRVHLLVDFGDELALPADSELPDPVVRLSTDGVASTPVLTTSTQRVDGDRAVAQVSFLVPAQSAAALEIALDYLDGFDADVEGAFSVVDPTVQLAVTDCLPHTACDRYGAVGELTVEVTVPGATTQQTVVLQTALDDVPALSTTTVVAMPTQAGAVGLGKIAVPAAPDGTTWSVRAQLGRTISAPADVLIRAPRIDSSLSCGSTCSLGVGAPVTLSIRAPLAISSRQASVTRRLDGVVIGDDAVVALSTPDIGTQTISSNWTITAPSAAGTWQIDVTVAGYRSDTIEKTIVPAAP